MEHLLDTKITKVYKGPDGDSEYGHWQVYNLYFDKGDKNKFGYMQSGKKPIPIEGMQIKHVEYEIEQDGKYTNYKIKKLEPAEDESEPISEPTQKHIQPQSNGNKDASFYIAYAKDIVIAQMQINSDAFKHKHLIDISKDVVEAGLLMLDIVNNKISIEKPKIGATVDDRDKGKGKVWKSRKEFVEEIRGFKNLLDGVQYQDILELHKIEPDKLNALNKDQGLALWKDLNSALDKQNNDDIPY